MRLPLSPPSDWVKLPPSRMMEVVTHVRSPVTNSNQYLHWNELRRHQPPEGLTREEWWQGLSFQRQSLAKSFPLLAVDKQQPFSFVLLDSIQEFLHETDLQGGGSLEAQDLGLVSADQRDRYLVSSLIEESINSSLIEGAATTRSEARNLLRSGRKPISHGERMVVNNFLAMQRLKTLKNRPLNIALILELHGVLTEETLENENQAGRFRLENERIHVMDENDQILHTPPEASELPHRIQALCDFANEKTPGYFIHPVIRSILIHFWLAYDHPFVDGNGRTARALFYWSMLRHRYWLFEYISLSEVLYRHVGRYRKAFLHCEAGPPDATYFVLNQMDAIREALSGLRAYWERKSAELRGIEQRIRNASRFNHRQLALLAHALRHPHHRYTVKSHETSHKVTPQTARTDLKLLCDAGLLEMRRWGRSFVFTTVQDFERKLDPR